MANPLSIIPRVKSAIAAFRAAPAQRSVTQFRRPDGGTAMMRLQHFDAADTNRLNEHRWALAGENDINAILAPRLAALRGRSRLEARNNPYARGVMETYATHVVGPTGPMLQIKCEASPEFGKALERNWWRFVERGDASGTQTVVEMAQLWIGQCWTDGEYLVQSFLDPRDGLLLNDIDPSRLATNQGVPLGDNHVVMGIERTPLGRPVRYHIYEMAQGQYGQYSTGAPKAVDANFILHRFQQWYPNQARGIPWFAPGLEDISSSREYDEYVLETAKGAARAAGWFTKKTDDAVSFEAPEFFDSEPGQFAMAPDGYEFSQIKAEQPTAQYAEFIRERRRGMGRVKAMPLLIINLDAGNHNMAGARFDGKIYEGQVKRDQYWMTTGTFNPLLAKIAAFTWITEFKGFDTQAPPYDARWTCETVPATDPYKDTLAAHQRIVTGISSKTREASALGYGLDDVMDEQVREIAEAKERGLPLGPYGEAAAMDESIKAGLEEDDSAPAETKPVATKKEKQHAAA